MNFYFECLHEESNVKLKLKNEKKKDWIECKEIHIHLCEHA